MSASTNCECPVWGGRKQHWINCPWRPKPRHPQVHNLRRGGFPFERLDSAHEFATRWSRSDRIRCRVALRIVLSYHSGRPLRRWVVTPG